MTERERVLIGALREAARLVRAGGEVHSDHFGTAADCASEIELLAELVERGGESPLARVRAFLARKRAKVTWCALAADLDDYLAGADGAADLGATIYDSL